MAISKLNVEQYANLATNSAGIVLVYAGKEGKNTAMHFFGADFEPADKTQDELFKAVKNLVSIHWDVKIAELKFREYNDGIRSKLRASTPARIIVRTAKGETVRSYDVESTVWAKIGLTPTNKDLERSARDQKKYQHYAAIAMMDALDGRMLPVTAEKPAETKIEAPAKADAKKAA